MVNLRQTFREGTRALYKGFGSLEDPTQIALQDTASPEKQKLRSQIVSSAETLLNQPYFSKEHPENPACTDVYVRSVPGLEIQLKEDFETLADPTVRYTNLDRRMGTFTAVVKSLLNGSYDNQPHNPFFVRRIQNLLPFQQAQGVFYKPNEITPEIGMAIYWIKSSEHFPSHIGVVAEVEDGEVTKVIHASASKKRVIRDTHQKVLDSGLKVFGFGDVSLIKK